MCSSSCDPETAVLIAVDKNVAQIIVQAELKQIVTGMGNSPSVLVMVFHNQAMGMGAVSESPVMVSTATGTVLNTQDVIMVVHHFMQQCGTDLFDGTGQSTGTNVDLMCGTLLADPGIIPEREMPVGLWRGLNCDGWS